VNGVTRLPIDRVFSMKGFGTVVTGTLVSGRVAIDDELLIAPGDRRVKVRGVQVHGERRHEAIAGQRSAVNLAGVEVEDIARGHRYVVRPYSPPVTIAGGLLLDPKPPRTAIRTAAARDRVRRLDFDPSFDDRVQTEQRAATVMVDEAGAAGLPVAALVSRAG